MAETAASMLADGPCVIENVPVLRDITSMSKVLSQMGVGVHDVGPGTLTIDGGGLSDHIAPYELVRTMRASILVMGPLLAKLGKAKVALPGGCAIGTRPIDIHLKGIEALGGKIKTGRGYVQVSARKLRGAEIFLEFPSVGATENLMTAGVLAQGKTVIGNAVIEESMADVKAGVRRGKDLARPLKEVGVFPPMLIHMVDLGQRSGQIEGMLLKVADIYDDDIGMAVDALVGLLEPVIIIVMGVFVGFLVLSILLPILNMSKNI